MRQVYLCMLFIPVLFTQGCLILPLPTPKKVLAGRPVTEQQLAFIRPGLTVKSEVIERLGEPDVFWETERIFAYNWEMRHGVLLWAAGVFSSGAAGAENIVKHYALLIHFDQKDRVQRFERTTRSALQPYGEFLMDWLDRSKEKSSTSTSKQKRGQ